MDIRHTRRLIGKRLDDAIEVLQELRSDIGSFEEDERWLADGLETVLENISQLASFADGGDFTELLGEEDDDSSDSGVDSDSDDDDDAQDDDVEGELDFGDESYED
jgi:hypothetical protein